MWRFYEGRGKEFPFLEEQINSAKSLKEKKSKKSCEISGS